MRWIVASCLVFSVARPAFAIEAQSKSARSDQPRPNVLLIVTDDQGWWDLGVHGNKTLETPHLDRLAKESVRFSRFYVAPVCAPTRAGLMTGRYAFRTGLYNTRFGGDTMADSEVTLAELLKKAGYRTGIFGKWHLGRYKKYAPESQGFDESLALLHGHAERYDYPDQLLLNGKPVECRGYMTDLLTDAAISFVKQHRERPFFCYVPYNVPHSPFIVGDSHALQKEGDALIAKYLKRKVPLREARIYAMIERADRNIGRLLKSIDSLKLREKTIVLFMSDNGGIHKHFNAGLRGRKASVYEGGVRSPLIVRWPGRFPKGKVVDAVTSHIDILPTLCDLLKIPLPKDREMDGKSILPLLKNGGGKSPHRYVYHSWNRYVPLNNKKWAIGGERYKLANGKLFDLQQDPGEKTDIAAKHPDRVRRMRKEFVRWFAEVTRGQTYRPVRIEVGRNDEDAVELQASWATLVGKSTRYTFRGYDWDSIDGWSSAECAARWRLQVVNAGRYEVTVSYGADPTSAGSVFDLGVNDARLSAKVESTLTRDIFVRRKLGEIRLSRGTATLEVKATKVMGRELMTLNRIWLRRIK